MKFYIFVALFVSAVFAENIKEIPEARIIQGDEVPTNEQYPWIVGIFYKDKDSKPNFCGGSLIDKQWVVTAAHCVYKVTNISVRLGSKDLNSASMTFRTVATADIFIHPQYDNTNLRNDIAVFKLNASVTFSNTIKAISLPKVGDRLGDNVKVIVSGWGRISDKNPNITSILRWAEVYTTANDVCIRIFTTQVTKNVTCTSATTMYPGSSYLPLFFNFPTSSKKGVCNGDSGGPLIQLINNNATLAGIISFVNSAGCETGYPVGYSRTESYLSFIKDTTGITGAPV